MIGKSPVFLLLLHCWQMSFLVFQNHLVSVTVKISVMESDEDAFHANERIVFYVMSARDGQGRVREYPHVRAI